MKRKKKKEIHNEKIVKKKNNTFKNKKKEKKKKIVTNITIRPKILVDITKCKIFFMNFQSLSVKAISLIRIY